jgi:membrane-bound inhibitor of C-type lysozyme
MRRLPAFALATLALPTAAAARDAVPEGTSLSYACAGGASLEVAYINVPGGASYAVVAHDGALVPMKAGPTGSGVRYLSLDDSALVWHTKGDQGFLARDDADETMIATDCTAAG